MDNRKTSFKNATELLTFLQKEGFRVGVPIDLDKIVSLLGIAIKMDASLEERDVVGEIYFDSGRAVIGINPIQNSYSPRKRFTLAHELGHYCLHSVEDGNVFVDSRRTMSRTESYWDSYESQANGFAAQLLMPKPLILKEGRKIIDEYKEKNDTEGMPMDDFISELSSRFVVSSKAMEYRLKNLKIIK